MVTGGLGEIGLGAPASHEAYRSLPPVLPVVYKRRERKREESLQGPRFQGKRHLSRVWK